MIQSFGNRGTEDVFNGSETGAARRRCPRALWRIAQRKLDQLSRVREANELAVPPGNRLKALRGKRLGQMSIRINDQYRICFRWEGSHALDVEITDYH